MIRDVVDPGVLVSGLIGSRGGAPDLVVRAFIDDRLEVVARPHLLDELERVLGRPKFSGYLDELTVRQFVERIRRHATFVDDPGEPPAATRDPKDDYLVALARREGVDALVSGDRYLIDAGFEELAVWTPRQLAANSSKRESHRLADPTGGRRKPFGETRSSEPSEPPTPKIVDLANPKVDFWSRFPPALRRLLGLDPRVVSQGRVPRNVPN